MYQAKIIKDSFNTMDGTRLTTFIVTYPRSMIGEFNTHKTVMKNGASLRAIPTKKILESVRSEGFRPFYFSKNQSGMQAKEQLPPDSQAEVLRLWEDLLTKSIETAEKISAIGAHKQLANRVIDPYLYQTMICTSHKWDNFFALRAHEDADPMFQKLAYLMLAEYNKSVPEVRTPGEWHIPFEDKMPENTILENKLKIACARIARVSYNTHDGQIDAAKDFELYDRLVNHHPRHMSPTEHIASVGIYAQKDGSYWQQYRHDFPDECILDDPRVTKYSFNGQELVKVKQGIEYQAFTY